MRLIRTVRKGDSIPSPDFSSFITRIPVGVDDHSNDGLRSIVGFAIPAAGKALYNISPQCVLLGIAPKGGVRLATMPESVEEEILDEDIICLIKRAQHVHRMGGGFVAINTAHASTMCIFIELKRDLCIALGDGSTSPRLEAVLLPVRRISPKGKDRRRSWVIDDWEVSLFEVADGDSLSDACGEFGLYADIVVLCGEVVGPLGAIGVGDMLLECDSSSLIGWKCSGATPLLLVSRKVLRNV